MGPTPFSAGYNGDYKTWIPKQWGQRLSALDTWQKTYSAARSLTLQWGQRISGWIHSVNQQQRLGGVHASMGPTPFSVGYNAMMTNTQHNIWRLQWGQRLSALETSRQFKKETNGTMLQWGQRLSALDTPERCQTYRPDNVASMGPTPFSVGYRSRLDARPANEIRAFNGANAFQRWIPDGRRRHSQQPIRPSMGPTPFSVGYLGCSEWGSKRSTGFNGANAFQRWIRRVDDIPRVQPDELQWGQRLSALDTGRHNRELCEAYIASMGPTPFSVGYSD